jgi:integrase
MATIRKKGDLQWHVQVRKKGHPTQTRTFTTRADAQRWGKETEIAIERGLFFDRTVAERTTLSSLIERYRKDVLPEKSGKHLAPALRQLDAAFGQYAVSSITSEMIATHRNDRLKTVSASTIRKEINLLSKLFDLAGKEWGIPIAANPCAMVSLPAEPKGRDRRLEEGEEARLIEACEGSESAPELVAIVQVALETGARLGELLKLRWQDVNLAKHTAKLLDTKNGEDRIIPLSSKAIGTLKSLPRHIHGRVFWRWSASDSFNKTWARACKRAGVNDLRFHDLRHEAVSRLFEKGLNPMEAASVSGHKTLAMLKRYTHLRAEDLAKKLG